MMSEERAMPDDTNRRVAEACGFEVCEESSCTLIRSEGTEERWSFFNPDSSASDSVLAAEKFGLFSGMMQCELEFNDGMWFVYLEGGSTPLGEGTFCESICQAILALHTTNQRT